MTNYKEQLNNLIENGATVEQITEALEKANKAIYTEHCDFVSSAEKPFTTLFDKNTCTIYGFNVNKRELTEKEKKVKSYDIEKKYRFLHSKATNKNGKTLPNNDITIFGDFKLICALHSFIKKCNNQVTKEVYTFNKKAYFDKVVNLDFSAIMDSKTALDKAVNNILTLVNISATYKKKYNDGLIHFATKQRINGNGITMSDTSVYDLMDYIIDCCKDRVTVKLSYMQEVKKK